MAYTRTCTTVLQAVSRPTSVFCFSIVQATIYILSSLPQIHQPGVFLKILTLEFNAVSEPGVLFTKGSKCTIGRMTDRSTVEAIY